MRHNSEYRRRALAALRKEWLPAVLGTAVYMLLMSMVASADGFMVRSLGIAGGGLIPLFLLIMPAGYGYANAIRAYYLHGDREVAANIFRMPLKFYADVVWTGFYMYVKLFLWTLVLVVPGVVKALSYSMTYYVLCDEPKLSAGEAIAKSARMMKGRKKDLLFLDMSFIGWFILSFLTAGIGFFWTLPYYWAAKAAFYEDLKHELAEKDRF